MVGFGALADRLLFYTPTVNLCPKNVQEPLSGDSRDAQAPCCSIAAG